MKRLLWILLACSVAVFPAHAESFDCVKAATSSNNDFFYASSWSGNDFMIGNAANDNKWRIAA